MKNALIEKKWKKLLAEFDHGNDTVSSFCLKNKLTKSSYYHWRKKLDPKIKISKDNFIDITQKNEIGITLKLNNQEITFSQLPDPTWAAKFILEVQNESTSAC